LYFRFWGIFATSNIKPMTGEIKQIASRIKGLRDIYAISAESLAAELGIAVEEYLKYESGNYDIPVGLMYKIAHKFDIELAALLSGDNPRLHVYNVVRKGEGLKVERRKQYKYENLAFNFVNKKAEPFMVTVEPETGNTTHAFGSHSGQEFNYIIEGSVMLIIDNHEIVLNEGDSVYFNSSYNHAMKAMNNKTARFIAVIL
jgi:transcriptional regulator with XRE-family HTH domain